MNHCGITSLEVQAGWVKLSDAFPANVARQLDDRNGFLRFNRREKALAFVATGEVKGSKRMCGGAFWPVYTCGNRMVIFLQAIS